MPASCRQAWQLEQRSGGAMVLAAVDLAEPTCTYRIGGGDARKHSRKAWHLDPALLVKHELGHLQEGLESAKVHTRLASSWRPCSLRPSATAVDRYLIA